jgi:hypothetical protein
VLCVYRRSTFNVCSYLDHLEDQQLGNAPPPVQVYFIANLPCIVTNFLPP